MKKEKTPFQEAEELVKANACIDIADLIVENKKLRKLLEERNYENRVSK